MISIYVAILRRVFDILSTRCSTLTPNVREEGRATDLRDAQSKTRRYDLLYQLER